MSNITIEETSNRGVTGESIQTGVYFKNIEIGTVLLKTLGGAVRLSDGAFFTEKQLSIPQYIPLLNGSRLRIEV